MDVMEKKVELFELFYDRYTFTRFPG